MISANKPPELEECDHEYEYKEDYEGDPSIPNGTHSFCWLECCICGDTKQAGPEDRPSYDDFDY